MRLGWYSRAEGLGGRSETRFCHAGGRRIAVKVFWGRCGGAQARLARGCLTRTLTEAGSPNFVGRCEVAASEEKMPSRDGLAAVALPTSELLSTQKESLTICVQNSQSVSTGDGATNGRIRLKFFVIVAYFRSLFKWQRRFSSRL